MRRTYAFGNMRPSYRPAPHGRIETALPRLAMNDRDARGADAAALASPSPIAVAAYVVAYVALDWVSFIDPVGAFAITPWNPPPGLSLAFLLRYGIRQGGWLFVAALAAEFLVRGAPAPLPILVAASLLLAGAYTGVTALLTRVLRFDADLGSLREATVFVVAAAGACGAIALAIAMLRAGSDGVLAPLVALMSGPDGRPHDALYFWMTGALSSFLGNAPNFMVKAIAESRGVRMPSFFGYLGWSLLVLVPVYVLLTLLFFV